MQDPTQNTTVPSHDDIASVAYNLWEQDGRPEGRDMEFWVRAEQQLAGGTARRDRSTGAEKRPVRAAGDATSTAMARKPAEKRGNSPGVSPLPAAAVQPAQAREKRMAPGVAR